MGVRMRILVLAEGATGELKTAPEKDFLKKANVL